MRLHPACCLDPFDAVTLLHGEIEELLVAGGAQAVEKARLGEQRASSASITATQSGEGRPATAGFLFG